MMAAVYRSKIDSWLLAVLVGAALVSLLAALPALQVGAPAARAAAVCIAGIGVGLPLWLLISTKYTLGHGQLIVQSGPFRWHIGVAEITSITPSTSLLSSPALSLDRLRIDYGPGKSLMISPCNKDRFFRDLESARRGLS